MSRPPLLLLRGTRSPRRPHIYRSCTRPSGQHVTTTTRSLFDSTVQRKEKEQEEWRQKAQMIRSGEQKSMLSILEERGFIKDIAGSRTGLDHLLTNKRTAAYAGIDPTAASLHLGHLLPLMILFWLHIHGYHTISLLGGATAKVGDPTGRLSSRSDMDHSTSLSNLTAMNIQVRGLWTNLAGLASRHGYKKDLSWKRDVWNNSTWLSKLTMVDFLAVLGRGARMGTMLGRDTVKNKMTQGDGMSFAEFTYPLLQAWDWWHMYNRHGVQLQIGGSDQYGNIIAGMDAIKYISSSQSPQQDEINPVDAPYGITVPLLTTSSGAKFGKSAGNAVWLDPDMTSPFDLYGFLLRSSDADVKRYLCLFTFLPLDKINATMEQHLAHPSERIAQKLLAREVLDLVHGPQIARETAHQHKLMRKPTLSSITSDSQDKPTTTTNQSPNAMASGDAEPSQSINKLVLPRSLVVNTPVARILYHAGLAPTKSAATRLIASNGAYIGGNTTWHSDKPMSDTELSFRPLSSVNSDIVNNYVEKTGVLVLRVGKWKVKVVQVVEDADFEARGLDAIGWADFRAAREQVQEVKDVFIQKKHQQVKKDAENAKEPKEKK